MFGIGEWLTISSSVLLRSTAYMGCFCSHKNSINLSMRSPSLLTSQAYIHAYVCVWAPFVSSLMYKIIDMIEIDW